VEQSAKCNWQYGGVKRGVLNDIQSNFCYGGMGVGEYDGSDFERQPIQHSLLSLRGGVDHGAGFQWRMRNHAVHSKQRA
jgi:hypothetical protein